MDVSSSAVLTTLVLCGLLGSLGQGIRAAIGLKNAGLLQPKKPDQQSEFDAGYFLVSMMIGFIAGMVSGLIIGLDKLLVIDPFNTKILLGIVVSGYAGADFIENSMSRVLPGLGNSSAPASIPEPVRPIDIGTSAPVLAPRPSRIAPRVDTTAHVTKMPGDLPQARALTTALRAVAPAVSTEIWVPALSAAFQKFGLTTDRRMAAAIGQFLVEAGSGFQERAEDMYYTHASRLVAIFPDQFPTEAAAQPYVDNPVGLANVVYANRFGNGDSASGDGYRFRGHGLIQLTGRDEYREFGETLGLSAEKAAAYCETSEGAAMSGAWYLAVNNCLAMADIWALSEITRRVNGPAMEANSERIGYANAILPILEHHRIS